MDERTDKKLAKFTGKILSDFSAESPSIDFTTNVMTKVHELSSARVMEYKPLITKRIWAVLAISVLGVFYYLLSGDIQTENSGGMTKALNFMPNFNASTLLNYKVSNVLLYAFVVLAFFVSIQTFLLKSHFDKRFAMD